MPLLVTGDTSLEGVVTTQPSTVSSVEKGLPSVEMAREAKQAVKDAESVPTPTSSIVQNLEATQSSFPQDPKSS